MRTFTSCWAILALATHVALAADPLTEQATEAESTSQSTEDFGALTETFYQHISVQRSPQFIVQGLRTGQQIQYHISSLFKVYEPDDEGYHKVVQLIESTKLVKADPLSRAVFQNSLDKMKGQSLTYTVTESGEILSVDGYQSTKENVDIEQPESKGMLVTSVLDEDGWKEIAQLTLFQPPEKKLTKPFKRRTTHDWGNLGNWYGETQFKPHSKRSKPKQYDYQHKLDYIAPAKGGNSTDTVTGLPFAIENAKFQLKSGAGEILYDHKKGYATAIRERFHARGKVTTKMLGQTVSIGIDEKQIFAIKISGQQTVQKAKVSAAAVVPSADRNKTTTTVEAN